MKRLLLLGSFWVGGLYPPESPEADISMLEDHDGPEPYLFEPLAPALVMPEARALEAQSVVRIALLWKMTISIVHSSVLLLRELWSSTTTAETHKGLKGNNK